MLTQNHLLLFNRAEALGFDRRIEAKSEMTYAGGQLLKISLNSSYDFTLQW